MNNRYFKSAVLTGIAAWLATINPLQAQDSQATTDSGIQEIVVTAQKRSESAQNVPITLNAVSAATLRDYGIAEVAQLEQLAPGTQLTSYSPIRPDFFIRGMGSSQVTTSVEHSVGVFVDEVYVPRIAAIQLGLRNAERIEVLKGPQGTLFGRNTTAGAVSFVTPNPTDTLTGSAEVRAGSFEGYGGTAVISGPLSNDVGGRIFVDFSKNRGYTENLTTGHYGNGDNTVFVATKLVGHFGDAKLTLSVDYAHSKLPGEIDRAANDATIRGPQGQPLQTFQNPNGPFYTPNPSFNKEYLNFDPHASRNIGRGYVRVDFPLAFADMVSLTSFYDTRAAEQVESDSTPLKIWSFDVEETSQVFSQEFRLLSRDQSPLTFGGRADWLLGVYYYNDSSDRTDTDHTYGDSFFTAPGVTTTNSFFNIRIHTNSFAEFGQYNFELLPPLKLTVGARYTTDTKRADIDAGSDHPGVALVASNFSYRGIGDTWDSFDPKVTVSYKPAKEALLYVTFSKGFKSGAFQTTAPAAFAATIAKPEKVENWEAGLKSRWFDGKLEANFAVFHDTYTNLQLQRIVGIVVDGNTQIGAITANAASAKVDGGEADINLEVLPGLTASVGYSHVNGKYENYLTLGADYSGNPLRNAPRDTYSLGLDAKHDLGDVLITGHVDYYHKSTIYFDVTGKNTPSGLTQNPYGLLDARISAAIPKKGWELALSGRNLTDKEYKNMGFGLGLGGSSIYTPAAPRSFEVSVRKSF